jgi:hypothetical protein
LNTVLTVVIGGVGIALAVLGGIAISLLASEARGAISTLCDRLLDRAAARLPEEMRDRREEWAAELYDAKDRPITQLVIAARVWLSGRSLAREAVEGTEEAERFLSRLWCAEGGVAAGIIVQVGSVVANVYFDPPAWLHMILTTTTMLAGVAALVTASRSTLRAGDWRRRSRG